VKSVARGARSRARARRSGAQGHAAEPPSSGCAALSLRDSPCGVTASRRRGKLPPCPFGERTRPSAASLTKRTWSAKSHRRAQRSRRAKRPRSGRLDGKHGDGVAPLRGKRSARRSSILINRNIVWTFQLFRRILAGVSTSRAEIRNPGAAPESPKNRISKFFRAQVFEIPRFRQMKICKSLHGAQNYRAFSMA